MGDLFISTGGAGGAGTIDDDHLVATAVSP